MTPFYLRLDDLAQLALAPDAPPLLARIACLAIDGHRYGVKQTTPGERHANRWRIGVERGQAPVPPDLLAAVDRDMEPNDCFMWFAFDGPLPTPLDREADVL